MTNYIGNKSIWLKNDMVREKSYRHGYIKGIIERTKLFLLVNVLYCYLIVFLMYKNTKEVENMKFARNLKLLRRKMGYTQEKMAEMCDVSRTALVKWEQGRTIPDVYMLDKIARIFGVTLDELVHDGIERILIDKDEKIIKELAKMRDEIISAIGSKRSSDSIDLYNEYSTYMNEREFIDEDVPAEAYSYWGMEEVEKGNYSEAIKLFEAALVRGEVGVVDSIMGIYDDVIDLHANENDAEKYWEWRLVQAKKMQQYGKIIEKEIMSGRVF